MGLALLLGSLGKQPWQLAEMRYGFWQLCLFCAPRGRSSPVRAKITIALSVRRVFIYLFFSCHFFFWLDYWNELCFPSAPAHKADAIPSRLLILSACPPGVCRGAAAVVIAFRTSLGSGPRIFQLWSLKPITHLLREDTHKPTWMKAFCATCLGFSTSCLCCNTV